MSKFSKSLAELGRTIAQARGAPAPLTKALGTQPAPETGTTLSGEQFMAKALDAQKSGFITGRQVAEAEAAINAGKYPERGVVVAVVQNQPYWPF
jgi:hypothetical protein